MLSSSSTAPTVPTWSSARSSSTISCHRTAGAPKSQVSLFSLPSSYLLGVAPVQLPLGSSSLSPILKAPPSAHASVVAMASTRPLYQQVTNATAGSTAAAEGSDVSQDRKQGMTTLSNFLSAEGANVDTDLAVVIHHIEAACKRISSLLASPTALPLSPSEEQAIKGSGGSASVVGRDVPKPLDLVSVPSLPGAINDARIVSLQQVQCGANDSNADQEGCFTFPMMVSGPLAVQMLGGNRIIKEALQASGKVETLASEEEDEAVWLGEGPFVVVFDPLDGSRNIDASIPTGTIFGIYKSLKGTSGSPAEKALQNVLQPGSNLVAAGYVLYSSATILCLTLGHGSHGFTLDRALGEFLLTYPNMTVSERGQIYSLNDARYFDWPDGLRRYIDDIRQGKGQFPKKYSARYVCSLVADLHRTILYGGLAMNPRSHLRLVYELNPLGYLTEEAGGKASDGKRRILDIEPKKLHERLPAFFGSTLDIAELESYGDVQQVVNPGYEM